MLAGEIERFTFISSVKEMPLSTEALNPEPGILHLLQGWKQSHHVSIFSQFFHLFNHSTVSWLPPPPAQLSLHHCGRRKKPSWICPRSPYALLAHIPSTSVSLNRKLWYLRLISPGWISDIPSPFSCPNLFASFTECWIIHSCLFHSVHWILQMTISCFFPFCFSSTWLGVKPCPVLCEIY